MARRESKAVAGYFPTPDLVLERIAASLVGQGGRELRVLDPCAGDGRALRSLSRVHPNTTTLYGCEMERGRFRAARGLLRGAHLLRGDFFQVRANAGVFGCVYLNPPYDHDREHKRLEERFLRAVVPMLAAGGVLVYVVPHYSLSASASTLAQHFTDLRVYRFPDPEYATFKQVVVFARRRASLVPAPSVVAVLDGIAADGGAAPVLADLPAYAVPGSEWMGCDAAGWKIVPFDPAEVAGLDPWVGERGPVPGLAHPVDLSERIGHVYPVVMPPRPVHLAAALAAGVFNGIHVHPDPESAHLPPLLLKGTFERVWHTVEEKHDEDGDIVSETQIEKPILTVWALDLSAARYHELRASGDLTDPQQVSGMTFGDLLDCYSASMLDQLRASCPVLHDPSRDDEAPVGGLARPLWAAQTSALHALDKSLNAGRGGLIVGEVGTGKTSIALALAKKRGRSKVLVVCPPHLLKSWADQVAYVVPEYRAVTVDTPDDLADIAHDPRPTVAILSRERAKLGHGWRDLRGTRCPRCGWTLEGGASGRAEKRARCGAPVLAPTRELGAWFHRHRYTLARAVPGHDTAALLFGKTLGASRFLASLDKHAPTVRDLSALDDALLELFGTSADGAYVVPADARDVLVSVTWARPGLAGAALDLLGPPPPGESGAFALRLKVAMAAPTSTHIARFEDPDAGYRGCSDDYRRAQSNKAWQDFETARALIHGPPRASDYVGYDYRDFGVGTHKGSAHGSREALHAALTALWEAADLRPMPCGEPTYQADGPRRFPLATHIARRTPDLFGMLVIDEAHEYGAEDSAQAIAVTRLAQAHRGDLLYMTGSLVNGYASSAFNVLRAVSPDFRRRFQPDQRADFVDLYGLRKRVLVHKDGKARPVRYGAHSERRLTGAATRKAGEAPGVLPVLLLEHILQSAAIIQKADLELALPSTSEEAIPLALAPEQERNLTRLCEVIADTIAKTRFTPGLSGKLFGALTRLVSYPDLAACGPYGASWPESAGEMSGQPIVCVAGLDPTTLWPKEAWTLNALTEERAEGRRVLIAPTHVEVSRRYAWVCEQAGIQAVVLDADKVPPSKREAWLNERLIKPGREVLIANPTTIQTGLNNLVALSSLLWVENPDCNPIRYRQANGRLNRPGQTRPTRFRFPYYQHRLIHGAYKLLMHKVGISLAADGLDPDAVLQAAGVESEFATGLSVGHQLYRMLVQQAQG